MSPELMDGQPIDTRADLWAVAVMLFRMVTGHMPFVGADYVAVMRAVLAGDVVRPSTLRPRLGAAIDAFFAVAFARDISLRYQTIDALEAAFVAASRRQPPSTPRPGGPPPGGPPRSPRLPAEDGPPPSCVTPVGASPTAFAPTALMPTLPSHVAP